MKKILFVFLFVLATSVPAMAKTVINIDTLNQDDFKAFSRDFGMAFSYQPVSPAAPLGDKLPGFDIGVEASYVKLDTGALYFQKMDQAGNLPDALLIPRVHVQVGLPIIPIDLGVSYTKVPNSDIKLTGYELKYAILEGGVATPALAIRAAYTKLSGLDVLNLSTKSVDLSISKGILIFTPYAGVGEVWITSTPEDQAARALLSLPALEKENIAKPKVFAGVKIKIFPFMNFVAEGDFSVVNEYTARLNVSF